MTETERIISEGIISKEFLEKEIRSGFVVESEKKKIWAIEIDLLLKFSEVCRRHNLHWFLMFGSLLGAIRHQGFIPWDDDLDIAMPRSDYEKLLTLNSEFTFPYFLQTPYTDEGYFYSFAKIRNSNTSMIAAKFINQGYNQGIAIDIFPLDQWDKEKGRELFSEIKELIIKNSTFMRLKMINPTESDIKRINQYDNSNPFDTYNRIQSLAKTFSECETKYLSVPVLSIYGYDKMVFGKEDFSSSKNMKFENNDCPIPVGFDKILETIYGNYLELPPENERGGWHDFIIDPDKTYKSVIQKLYYSKGKSS